MTDKKMAKTATAKPDYAPTSKEKAVLAKFKSRDDAAHLAPRMKLQDHELSIDHPEPAFGLVLLQEALGTADADFVFGLLGQLAAALPKDFGNAETQINFMVSVVKSIRPRDQVEAMLAAQMAIIHASTVTLGRRLMKADTIPQQDSAERALNKLARTFAAQIDALERYRSSSEQRAALPPPSSEAREAAVAPGATAQIAQQRGADQPEPSVAVGTHERLSSDDQVPLQSHDVAGEPAAPARVVPMKRASGGR
jgi:hypothetical protein